MAIREMQGGGIIKWFQDQKKLMRTDPFWAPVMEQIDPTEEDLMRRKRIAEEEKRKKDAERKHAEQMAELERLRKLRKAENDIPEKKPPSTPLDWKAIILIGGAMMMFATIFRSRPATTTRMFTWSPNKSRVNRF